MGVILPSIEHPDGFLVTDAYGAVDKDRGGIGIRIRDAPDPSDGYMIEAWFSIWTSFEARMARKKAILTVPIQICCSKDSIGDIFFHLYNRFKDEYPGAYDLY